MLLFFEEAPSRIDLVSGMRTLATKYERMGAVPRFEAGGECVWDRLRNIDASIEKAVVIDSEYDNKFNDEVHSLHRAHIHIGTILPAEDEAGEALPRWRVVLLSPTAALIRIDHCVCDGLSGE